MPASVAPRDARDGERVDDDDDGGAREENVSTRRDRRGGREETTSEVRDARGRGMTSALYGALVIASRDRRDRARGRGGDDDYECDDGHLRDGKRRNEGAAATTDVELCALRRTVRAMRETEDRAVISGAVARWRAACTKRIADARVAAAFRRRATRRELRRYFSVWLVQTPSATRAMDGVNDRFGGHARRSRHIAGLVDDDEFPTDYRAELEIRLVQIARLEDALRDANARATNEMREEDVEAHMRKFREHLQNVQRELENVKRERDAYRREWEAADGPSAVKAKAERRANQRTMATQTNFDEEMNERRDAHGTVGGAKEPPPPTKRDIRAVEEKWMEHARQFEKKFERQLEVTAEYERKLREERTRLMHSEARYEKRIEDMTTKHAEEVTELTLRGVAPAPATNGNASSSTAATTGADASTLNRERFVKYAKLGAETANRLASPISLTPASPAVEVFESPSAEFAMDDDEHAVKDTDRDDADRDQITVKQPTRFENAPRLPFTLDEFSSSEDERDAADTETAARRASPTTLSSPPSDSHLKRQMSAKKPLRLTVAVAKLVVLGRSQRDAIEALKHVDGNDVAAANEWLDRRDATMASQ